MSRKRVPAKKTAQEPGEKADVGSNKAKSAAITMAMSGNRNLIPPNPAGPSRRILSLSQITNNVPTGGFKRSQSVRHAGGPGAMRKSSWAGARVPPAQVRATGS